MKRTLRIVEACLPVLAACVLAAGCADRAAEPESAPAPAPAQSAQAGSDTSAPAAALETVTLSVKGMT